MKLKQGHFHYYSLWEDCFHPIYWVRTFKGSSSFLPNRFRIRVDSVESDILEALLPQSPK